MSSAHDSAPATSSTSESRQLSRTADTAGWTPSSHRTRPALQVARYAEERQAELGDVLSKLRRLPGLVTPVEIERLRSQLADVAAGKAFVRAWTRRRTHLTESVQGGDCAETFDDCGQGPIESRLSLLLLMSLVLVYGARMPVVRIGRIAGQYAKPRSSDVETLADGRTVPSFRGDNVRRRRCRAR